jgi:hypothetical protein
MNLKLSKKQGGVGKKRIKASALKTPVDPEYLGAAVAA